MEDNQSLLQDDLRIDAIAQTYLSETAKWCNFLGIMGFIASGIIALMAIFAKYTNRTNSFTDSDASVVYEIIFRLTIFVIAVVNFFTALFLYRFAQKMKVALQSNDQLTLNESFLNLKKLYKFAGILAIIYSSFLVLMIIAIAVIAIAKGI